MANFFATNAAGFIPAAFDAAYAFADARQALLDYLAKAKAALPRDDKSRKEKLELLKATVDIAIATQLLIKRAAKTSASKEKLTKDTAIARALEIHRQDAYSDKRAGKEGTRTKTDHDLMRLAERNRSNLFRDADMDNSNANGRGGANNKTGANGKSNAGAKGNNSEEKNTQHVATAEPAPASTKTETPKNTQVIHLPAVISGQLEAAKETKHVLEELEKKLARVPAPKDKAEKDLEAKLAPLFKQMLAIEKKMAAIVAEHEAKAAA